MYKKERPLDALFLCGSALFVVFVKSLAGKYQIKKFLLSILSIYLFKEL